jgi:DNA-binding transcriptional MerR regulator
VTPECVWTEVKISDLAKDLKISRQAIYLWQKRPNGVPAERVSQVSKALGVPKEVIRPDLFL